jgi:hypothetical protein
VRWQEQAGCIGLAPLFDLDDIMPNHLYVCAECPVRMDCLVEGMRLGRERDFGIWGGLDRRQRWRVRSGRSSATKEWHDNLAALGVTS